MAKSKTTSTKKKTSRAGRPVARYRLVNTNWTGFADWKGEKIAKGTEIEVSVEDMEDNSLKNRLKLGFVKIGNVSVESESVKPISEEEAKTQIKESNDGNKSNSKKS